MSSIANADEYEKTFMVKYLKKVAQRKIDNLEKEIELTEDAFKKLEMKRQVRKIRDELEKEINELNREEQVEKANLGDKTKDLGQISENIFHEHSGIRIPMNVWSYLFEYQRQGLCWMIDLYKIGKGGVLADEMGLGKTIQICSFIISLVFSKKAASFLILAPATVIDQWIKQLNDLNPSLQLHRNLLNKSGGITVMSYESFRDIPIIPRFDCVFLDEGHKIKNKNANITNSVKRITSAIKFVITGTPIQNNLGELWSIFDFVNPSLLGSYTTFQEEFENKIKNAKTESEKQSSYYHSVMLRSMIEPFILRRMKYMIDHKLPNKIDKVIFISFTEKQYHLYCNTLESKRFKNCAIKGFGEKSSLLGAITFLRKICNHPILIKGCTFEDYKLDKADLGAKSEHLPDQKYQLPYKELVEDSAKLKLTFDMLDKWYMENKKALLFFQSIQMLQIAASAFTKFRPDFKFFIMTGSTPLKQRTNLIDTFNKDKSIFIFLLTTRVGGLGINLTGASRVIIYDPDWNPSTDSQAKERIYRFGQQSEVEIYRLITRDTLEEKIYQKQIYKDCLSKKILSDPDTVFEKEYFLDLFSMPGHFDRDISVENTKMGEVVNDGLVDVREEDARNFSILKNLNSKAYLTGPELLEYIRRRESSLSE